VEQNSLAQLPDQLVELAALAARLKAERKDFSEAATGMTFIEPILATLGWTGPDDVRPEYPVPGGTHLDYALIEDAKPVLCLEAKALRHSLDNQTFVDQVISYGTKVGVRWCVLTNGLDWRIFKSDAPPADQECVAEASLHQATGLQSAKRVAATLTHLSKESVTGGSLDEWGKRKFADSAIRRAVNRLLPKSPEELVRLVQDELCEEMASSEIDDSLARLRADFPQEAQTPFSVEDHTQGKPKKIVDMFLELDRRLRAFGPDVERVIRQEWIKYEAETSFATLTLQQTKLVMYVSLPLDESPHPEGLALKDVSAVGKLGVGDTKVAIFAESDVDGAEQIARASYEKSPRPE
jgi:hypothetical protein